MMDSSSVITKKKDVRDLNLMESGLAFVTFSIKKRPGETHVLLMEAAAMRPEASRPDEVWGSIEVAEGLRVPYSGCAGGKTLQKEDPIWERIFPKDGKARVDPLGSYTLESGQPFETGRAAALRELREETLSSIPLNHEEAVVKEFTRRGGYTTEWKGETYRSRVTVLHLHFEFPSEHYFTELLCDFNRATVEQLFFAHKRFRTGRFDKARYWRSRSEYRLMHIVPSDQYREALVRAAKHLQGAKEAGGGYGRLFWIETWPDNLRVIALRKWDLRVLDPLWVPGLIEAELGIDDKGSE